MQAYASSYNILRIFARAEDVQNDRMVSMLKKISELLNNNIVPKKTLNNLPTEITFEPYIVENETAEYSGQFDILTYSDQPKEKSYFTIPYRNIEFVKLNMPENYYIKECTCGSGLSENSYSIYHNNKIIYIASYYPHDYLQNKSICERMLEPLNIVSI